MPPDSRIRGGRFIRAQLGNIDPYCQVALFRVAGQRRPSKALVRVGAASPKGALHRLLGAEIVDFRFLDASPPVAAQASAAVLSEIVLPVPSAPVPVLPVEVPAVPVVLEVTADPPTVPMVSQIEVSPVLPAPSLAEPVPPASVPLPDPAPLVPALAAEAPIAPAPPSQGARAHRFFPPSSGAGECGVDHPGNSRRQAGDGGPLRCRVDPS